MASVRDRIQMAPGITFPMNDGDSEVFKTLIEDAWDIVEGFPVPRFTMTCFCSSRTFHILSYNFFVGAITESVSPYRCCIAFVCRVCSAVHDHRMVIPKEVFDMRSEGKVAFMYRWRDALNIMEMAGH